MKKGINSQTLSAQEIQGLSNLTNMITRTGHSITLIQTATIAAMLLSEHKYLSTLEGRKLLELCKYKLAGTAWNEVVFPKPLAPKQMVIERLLDRWSEESLQMLPQIETFFNQTFPQIDWEDEVPF